MIREKRIGIILDSFPWMGGSFQYAQCILNALAHICDKSTTLFAFYNIEEWENYFSSYPQFVTQRVPQNYFLAEKFIDSFLCDVVISDSQSTWAERLKTPVIVPMHDLMHRYETRFPEVSENGSYMDREFLFHGMMEHAEAVLVDSNIGREQALESYGKFHEDHVYVLPFTIPSYIDEEKSKKQTHNVSPFKKFIFYPAQFWKHKNHINLLRAMALLRDEGIDVFAVFVGSKYNGYNDVENLIKELKLEKHVSILGYVSNSEIKDLYSSARALIMPTFFGPTNIPPLEAMRLGCPVAISKVYGMPEQLGDAALYFEPNNIREIADVIKKIWTSDEECERLKILGFRQIVQYLPEVFNKKLGTIMQSVIKRIDNRKRLMNRIISFCRGHNTLYIYGAGKYGFYMSRLLKYLSICIQSYIETWKADYDNIDGLPVISLSDYTIIRKADDGIICAISKNHQEEVLNTLRNQNISLSNVYCIDDRNLEYLYGVYLR